MTERATSEQSRDRLPSDVGVFFTSWLRSPLRVASIVPSGRRLAAAIAAQIDPGRPGWVVELGGGTGSVTEQLLRRGVPPKRLFVLERDPVMARYLRNRFPEPDVVEGDATRLTELFERHGVNHVHSIVCGLPILAMPRAISWPILRQCLDALVPDGTIIQYTYSLFSPLPHKEFNLVPHQISRVLLNIPPAATWAYKRKDSRR